MRIRQHHSYVIVLAIIDIAACWTIRPFDFGRALAAEYEASLLEEVFYALRIACFSATLGVYMNILLMWACERLFAVACPFTFHEKLSLFYRCSVPFWVLDLTFTAVTMFLLSRQGNGDSAHPYRQTVPCQ